MEDALKKDDGEWGWRVLRAENAEIIGLSLCLCVSVVNFVCVNALLRSRLRIGSGKWGRRVVLRAENAEIIGLSLCLCVSVVNFFASVITAFYKPAVGGAVETVESSVGKSDVPFVAEPGVGRPPVAGLAVFRCRRRDRRAEDIG